MIAVDTNVLVYAHDVRDVVRFQQAREILDEIGTDGVLLWQVACEYLAASRKLVPIGYDIDDAWKDLADLRLIWDSHCPRWSVQESAQDLMQRFSLSIWDALLIAAALDAGVNALYSEDFDSYSAIDGLTLVNPFAESSGR